MAKKTKHVGRDWKSLSDDDKRYFYKLLVTNSFGEAATILGFDEFYNPNSLRVIGYNIYKGMDPDELKIDKDIQDLVKNAIAARKASKPIVKEKDLAFVPTELIDPKDNKEVVIAGRNKAAMLLHKKMDRINKNPKLLDAISITQLVQTFSTMFDKAQIVQGAATENIAIMANINNDMTPEESLDMILQMRESTK